jgi:hypothetical protein
MQSSMYATISILCLHVVATFAGGETGSGRISSGQCPENVEAIMVYSPFKPYWKYPKFARDVQKCWVATDCLLEAAGESRKQQFAATALIMGLIPLTLKDIAWPERRIVHITSPLSRWSEILVLALGLVPLPTAAQPSSEARADTRKGSEESNGLAKYAWRLHQPRIHLSIMLFLLTLSACYSGLVVNEIYSKRSALGCVYPLFIVTWYVVALLPAAMHSFFAFRRQARLENMRQEQLQYHGSTLNQGEDGQGVPLRPLRADTVGLRATQDQEQRMRIISAIQGADQDWPVQMAWGIYYIAGSLIFTSIMAVTVIELLVWVALCFVVTGCSKVLAFFLCLGFENTGGPEATVYRR